MSSDDKQIDLLLRRFARDVNRTAVDSHLDADEMNTFAEGKLSPAARAHYLSHLADCDDCRRQVSALAIGSGAVPQLETAAAKKEQLGFWQSFAGWFAIPMLRYAAFAAVLVIVAGVGFLVWRQSRPSRPDSLVAATEPTSEAPSSAVKPFEGGANQNKETTAGRPTPAPQSTSTIAGNPKREEGKVTESVAPASQPLKDQPAPTETYKKAAEPDIARVPSYAPPPPGETQAATRQQEAASAGTVSGPRKTEPLDKLASAGRERDIAKEPAKADDGNRAALNRPAPAPARRSADEKAKGPSRNLENSRANRNSNEGRAESQNAVIGGDDRSATEAAPTRSVGGHKFRKQGAAWVDQKFKSSMTAKVVSRGSDAFNELDSGLRAIAQQLGGEVIVLWKGKAYLIK
jgi:hypothetical protein